MVRAKLVKIGNSRGIRLANPLLEDAGLADEVETEAVAGMLTIRPSTHPRSGCAEAAAAFDPDGLLDEMTSTSLYRRRVVMVTEEVVSRGDMQQVGISVLSHTLPIG
jgi:antitoxin MazE